MFDLLAVAAPVVSMWALITAHELIHGMAMRRFGARPVHGKGFLYRLIPFFSCTAPGHMFSRTKFVIVALAPAVVISLGDALAVNGLGEPGGWLIIALVTHLARCIGDFSDRPSPCANRPMPDSSISSLASGSPYRLELVFAR